ncbi:MAG: hypothetical protein H7Y42_13900 [Chitinophagaceae bacterium]|nr:hypothetical protein [Chitinophagaceae bacterium]
MYQRKHSYDSLRESLKLLAHVIPRQNNVFSKSKEENDLSVFKRCLDLYKEKEEVGGLMYDQFCDLKGDFTSGKLNLARYKDKLLEYQEFFNSGVIKTDLPKSLKAPEIISEIEKYV